MSLFFTVVSGIVCALFTWVIIWWFLSFRVSHEADESKRKHKLELVKTESQIVATMFLALSGAVALFSFTQDSRLASDARRSDIAIAEATQFSNASEFLLSNDSNSTEAAISILRRIVGDNPEVHAAGASRLAKSKIETIQAKLSMTELSDENLAGRDELISLVDFYADATVAANLASCKRTATSCDLTIDLSFLQVAYFYGRILDGRIVSFNNSRTGRQARLPYADFSRTILEGADFSYVLLTDANFAEATLSKSEFRSAQLIGARFTGAKARHVNFTGAAMQESALIGADLECASLQGADLRGSASDLTTLKPTRIYPETILPDIIDRPVLEEMRRKYFGSDFGVYATCETANR